MSLDKGYTQGVRASDRSPHCFDDDQGSNADNLLSDSYVKGIRNGINWTDGLAAMRKDAEVVR